VPLVVRLQRKERERGREPVRDPGLHGDLRLHLAEDPVEIDALGVADRTEGVACAALDHCLLVLTPLLEQVIHQAAGPHLPLVTLEHVSAAEEARHFVANASPLGRTAWIANVPDGAVETAFQPGGHGRGSYRLPRWRPNSTFSGHSCRHT